ncbi:hypothetical protein ACLOJK_024270 [Asimina triloba]
MPENSLKECVAVVIVHSPSYCCRRRCSCLASGGECDNGHYLRFVARYRPLSWPIGKLLLWIVMLPWLKMGGSESSITTSAAVDRGHRSLVVEEMGFVTLRLLLLTMSSGVSSPVEIGANFLWVANWRKVYHEFWDDAADGHRTSNLVIYLLSIFASWDRDLMILGLTSVMRRPLSLLVTAAGDEEDVSRYTTTAWTVWKRSAANADDVYAFRLTTPCF